MIIKSKYIFYAVLFSLIFTGCRLGTYDLEDMVGVYVTNYDQNTFVIAIPGEKDTLILKKDHTFKSDFYGKGKYRIENNRLILTYKYEYGKAGFSTYIERGIFGTPKIILFEDLNYIYKKIK